MSKIDGNKVHAAVYAFNSMYTTLLVEGWSIVKGEQLTHDCYWWSHPNQIGAHSMECAFFKAMLMQYERNGLKLPKTNERNQ